MFVEQQQLLERIHQQTFDIASKSSIFYLFFSYFISNALIFNENATKSYFDSMNILFQSEPEHVLRVVASLIGILKRTLHQNLVLTNSLLQIMEFAFKHNQSAIKAKSFECWKALISNFALDRGTFFFLFLLI